MKPFVALLLTVLCLALPAYAPDAQDKPASESQDLTETLTTVAAREQALAAHLKSAREHRQSRDLLKAAQSLNQAGRLQLKLNQPDKALATFKESLTLSDQIRDPAAKVDALNGVAAAHLHSGKFDLAMPLVQQAIAIAAQNNYVRGRAEALLLLSDCENTTNHSQALKTAQDALVLWQSIGDNREIIRSHMIIGSYQLAQNSLEKATQSYETARTHSHESGLKDLEAEALINLGFIEYRKGAWHNVTKFLWDAGRLFDAESDPFKMTQITTSIAEAYIESGLPEKGLPKYYEALDYISKTKKPREETIVRWGVGRALYFSGKYTEALKTFEEALVQAKALKHPVIMAMCHDFLGRTHDAMNDHATALTHLEIALNLYSKTETTMEVARTRGRIGQIYENTGRLEEARAFYQQALQTFDSLSDRVNQSATLFALGRLEMKVGNYDKAEGHLRQSIEMTENMRRMSSSRDLTAAFSATVHDRYEQYIQCLMRNGSRAALAFETSESARARSLAELLRVNDTNLLSNIDPELSAQERSLRHQLRVTEDNRVSLLATKYDKNQLEKLDAELEKLSADYKNVLAAINARYPAYAQITQPQSWDLGRIQKEVISDDDTVLLEYFLGPEKSYLWAITRTGITSHELPSEMVITKAVQTLYDLVKERPKPETKEQLDQATRELAQMVLGPVADQLNKRQIIVAADGALNYIPFQMLLPSSTNSEPLVARHEIINAPSASILGELRKEAARRGVRAKALAIFGNPIFGTQNEQLQSEQRSIELKGDNFDLSTIGRLFYAAREIANLLEVASEAQTFAATDYDATRDKLLSTDLTQYAILHFATHGVLDPKRPEKSFLLLSNVDREGKTLNPFIELQDVYSLQAPVDLVVLSACETGLGKDIRGEGLVGLTRGFMYAGSTSVVASLWKVQDEATAELMKRFYTEMLKNGKTPAEALRSAQDSIRQIPKWSAPHYWAGFTLQGEYRYVVNSSRGWQAYQVVLLVALGVLLLAVVVYMKFLPQRRKALPRF
jgi:CHAT domain-containing protein